MPMSLLFTFSFYATEFYAVSGFALLEEDIHQYYFSAMNFMKLIRKLRRNEKNGKRRRISMEPQ